MLLWTGSLGYTIVHPLQVKRGVLFWQTKAGEDVLVFLLLVGSVASWFNKGYGHGELLSERYGVPVIVCAEEGLCKEPSSLTTTTCSLRVGSW